MEEKINKIVEIIGDYRIKDRGWPYNIRVDKDHLLKWLNQFDENDREFLVDELLHLLPNSYLTKEHTLKIISTEFDIISKDYGYEDINVFFDETKFLDCQPKGKSQKVFLDLIDSILKEKYGRSLSDCGTSNIKNWIYADDVLATGGTFREEIISEIEKFGREEFIDSGIRIIGSFIILHDWAVRNVKFTIDQRMKTELKDRLKFYRVAKIENCPIINYYNSNPKLNHVYPKASDEGKKVLKFVENNLDIDHKFRNEEYAFRNANFPKEETFFSSSVNRDRYEKILLDKGFEIMKSIDKIGADSLRPLGMTNPSNKTLGTGTHFFTWRNISNTCPIVFWWGSNGWYPLFPVKNRGNNLF